jgi:DNA-binding transcriptional LysR family regulator
MASEKFDTLFAFLVIAREGSFTKAAAQLGVSQSALSHTIRGLETRLDIRLLTRTTRSVSPTEAGERLLQTIRPRFEEIEFELTALSELRDKPAGTIRITASEHSANAVLWPKLAAFLPNYPDINVEVVVDYGLTDIVLERYDAGIRLGNQVDKDMISVRIAPDLRMAVVASPDYFLKNAAPQVPQDLSNHRCINLRLPTKGNLFTWEFEKGGHNVNLHVQGQLVFNSSQPILRAALAGFGVAYIPEDMATAHIEQGKLTRVLNDWCPYYQGYHLYYASRRQSSLAFKLLINALRHEVNTA